MSTLFYSAALPAASRVLCITLLFVSTSCSYVSEQLPVDHIASDKMINGSKWQHLHVIFRHGDRTPVDDIVNSESKIRELWPSGPGQLTERGIVQEFELGQWFRTKYDAFIPQKYNGSDFHLRSTDMDRTLMSAQAFAAGVYQNSSSPLHPFGIEWRPIPVHTVSQEDDVLLSQAPCPYLDVLRRLQMDSDESLKVEESHRPLFRLLKEKLSLEVDRYNIWKVADTLICMQEHNVSFPSWCTDQIFREILEVDSYYWNLQFTRNADILRLEIGVFLSVFVDHVTAVVNGFGSFATKSHNLSAQHIFSYSAHDSDIAYLLSALGTYDSQLVKYSGAVVLELMGPDLPGVLPDYRIRIFYKRGYDDLSGKYLILPPCRNHSEEDGCPMDLFMAYIKPFLLKATDFATVCSTADIQPLSVQSVYIIVGVIGAACLISMLTLAIACYIRTRRVRYTFERLDDSVPA